MRQACLGDCAVLYRIKKRQWIPVQGGRTYQKTSTLSNPTTQESDTVMTFSLWRRRKHRSTSRRRGCFFVKRPQGRRDHGLRMVHYQRGTHWVLLREEMGMAWNHIWRIEYWALGIFWTALLCKPNPLWIRIKMYLVPIFLIKTEKWRLDTLSDSLPTHQKNFRTGGEMEWQRSSSRWLIA